jgi:hypothetical protein
MRWVNATLVAACVLLAILLMLIVWAWAAAANYLRIAER